MSRGTRRGRGSRRRCPWRRAGGVAGALPRQPLSATTIGPDRRWNDLTTWPGHGPVDLWNAKVNADGASRFKRSHRAYPQGKDSHRASQEARGNFDYDHGRSTTRSVRAIAALRITEPN